MAPRNARSVVRYGPGLEDHKSGSPRARARARGHRQAGRIRGRSCPCPRVGACAAALSRRPLARARRPARCVLPDDADARDAAEAAGWFLGEERVGLFASRGVRWGTGLEPPPHLVGERARALEVLAADGLVCASAIGAVEGSRPLRNDRRRSGCASATTPASRPSPSALPSPVTSASTRQNSAASLRFAGASSTSFPSTGREPVRLELFGDEIESIRAFSAFTQRDAPRARGGPDLSRRRAATRPRRALAERGRRTRAGPD